MWWWGHRHTQINWEGEIRNEKSRRYSLEIQVKVLAAREKSMKWQDIPNRTQLHKPFKTGQSQHTLRKALGNVKLCLDNLLS